ncbi:MAG: polysaccharide biosynthesis/export family protein [Candidatus Omnitrophota bacterium]|nr:polysaccharide biosynthesis/export family protein [Candidatus Omnitrophota bacterium]
MTLTKSLTVGLMAWIILVSPVTGVSALAAATGGQGVDESYQLQPGDRLQIRIYPEDEFVKGGDVEVSSEGTITLSLIGRIAVSGKTVSEAEGAMREVLSNDYFVNPEVAIEVLEYKGRSFVVLGSVVGPGSYDFPPGATRFTLLQAVSMARGFSPVANIKKIKIIRQGDGGETVIQANADDIIKGQSSDIVLEADDVIHVSESWF